MIRHLKNKHGFSHEGLVDLKPTPANTDVLLQEELLLSNSHTFSRDGAFGNEDSTGSAVMQDMTPDVERKHDAGLFNSFERDLNDDGEEMFKHNLFDNIILQIPLVSV